MGRFALGVLGSGNLYDLRVFCVISLACGVSVVGVVGTGDERGVRVCLILSVLSRILVSIVLRQQTEASILTK